MIVLELIPELLAKYITESISIPAIGIGGGRYCDGQVQVLPDILGLNEKVFKHVKKYADMHSLYSDVVRSYIKETQEGYFPGEEQVSALPEEVIEFIRKKRDTGSYGEV